MGQGVDLGHGVGATVGNESTTIAREFNAPSRRIADRYLLQNSMLAVILADNADLTGVSVSLVDLDGHAFPPASASLTSGVPDGNQMAVSSQDVSVNFPPVWISGIPKKYRRGAVKCRFLVFDNAPDVSVGGALD